MNYFKDVSIRKSKREFLELLQERLEYWTSDYEKQILFMQMYQERLESGFYDGITLDIMELVDNDYVNNYKIVNNSLIER